MSVQFAVHLLQNGGIQGICNDGFVLTQQQITTGGPLNRKDWVATVDTGEDSPQEMIVLLSI